MEEINLTPEIKQRIESIDKTGLNPTELALKIHSVIFDDRGDVVITTFEEQNSIDPEVLIEIETYESDPVIIPPVLMYKEALKALSEGKPVLCKPVGQSSFIADSYLKLKRFSGTLDPEEHSKFKYSLL